MAAVAFALPILPGQEDLVRSLGKDVSGSGGLREEYEEARKRLGIREEKAWVQRTPIGASIIAYWETYDPQRTLREIADSQDQVDKRFKQVVENAAPAIDLYQENPLSNELLFEWHSYWFSEKASSRHPVNNLLLEGRCPKLVFEKRSLMGATGARVRVQSCRPEQSRSLPKAAKKYALSLRVHRRAVGKPVQGTPPPLLPLPLKGTKETNKGGEVKGKRGPRPTTLTNTV